MYRRPVGQAIFANWLATTSAMSGKSPIHSSRRLVPGSRLLSSDWSVTAGAFVGTNPADEPITPGLPLIHPIGKQHRSNRLSGTAQAEGLRLSVRGMRNDGATKNDRRYLGRVVNVVERISI
jgi:hypothetical protein